VISLSFPTPQNSPNISRDSILAARQEVLSVHLAAELEAYIVQLVAATRQPEAYDPQLKEWVAYGASPRGSISMALAGRAHAWLAGRDYVSPEDLQQIAKDVLRHRIVLSYDAEADGISAISCVKAGSNSSSWA